MSQCDKLIRELHGAFVGGELELHRFERITERYVKPRKPVRGKANKPCPHKNVVDGVITYPDGREVCDEDTKAGRNEYYSRTYRMNERQGWKCAICGFRLPCTTMTFDHENGRGGGKRDDRIEVDGRPQNAAVCLMCNSEKGSKRTPYRFQVQP